MIDLWPDDTPSYTSLKAPVTILREQATLLGRKTGNIVEGLVWRNQNFDDDDFRYHFYLVAPALNDYRYQLLMISHSIELYPLTIQIGADIFEELSDEVKGEIKDENDQLIDIPQERFTEILKAIFATKKVRKVIEAMIAQSVGEQ